MIPYFPQPVIVLGRWTLHAFSLLLVTGILVGRIILIRRARRAGIPHQRMVPLYLAMLIAALGGVFLANALLAGAFDLGMASIGGVAAALPVGIVTARFLGFSYPETLTAFDAIAYAAPFAAAIGRLGCALAHDHRGLLSHSWLAVQFPEGTRYDLGLIEFLFLCGLALLFWRLGREPRPAGFFIGVGALSYGLFRIWRDTLDMLPHSTGWAVVALFGALVSVAASPLPQRVWRDTRRAPPFVGKSL